jgi:hypothetical protein
VNIWTERLERRHLPLLEGWIGRGESALTANDLPAQAEGLARWFERSAAEAGRLDCLALVYETPVGVAALRPCAGQEGTAELTLLLGEKNYNPLRTATYIALRMLDRAFLERGLTQVGIRVCAGQDWLLEPLGRMGFRRTAAREGLIGLSVDREDFLSRKYLF